MTATTIAIILLFASFLLTRWMRRYAVRDGMLDRPNARSSHVQPTPRGGGVSFVVTTLAATLGLATSGELSAREASGILLGGSLVAIVGAIDDKRGLAARWRFSVHMISIAFLIGLMASWDAALLHDLSTAARAVLLALALVSGIWLINLTNFMDGIDGIAGTEAVTVCSAIAICGVLTAAPRATILLPVFLAAGALGFLLWNWPPARIFMGDAGSGFLGFCFAALTFQSAQVSPPLFWCWVIMLGVFVTDATVTIVRRQLRGERVTLAHRTHGYQHAARRWNGHRPVTVTVGMVNLFWLLPCTLLVTQDIVAGPVAVLIAYSPLVGLAVWAQSGAPEVFCSPDTPIAA